jgi:TPR repeat protein
MNDVRSNYKLGLKYLHGVGVSRDLERALTHIEKFANQGFTPAQISLAFMYLDDNNIFYNPCKSFIIFKYIAKEEYHKKAQFMVGIMYEYGEGVSENIKNSLKYYKLSADQGNTDALEKLIEY